MDPVLNYFIKEGILGVIVVGLIIVAVYLYQKLDKCRDNRIKDHQAYTQTVKDLMEGKIQMQEKHTDNIMGTQKEVDKMVTHLTSTLEALITALARGVDE
jgi:uncharacterized protein YoxC